MRIPLNFDEEKSSIFLNIAIRIPGRVGPFPATFIIDTGSPLTFMDEFYSSKFRIFAKNLPFDSFIYMGGTKVSLYKLGKSEFILRSEGDKLESMAFDSLKVARTAWTKKEATYAGESILGLDFLKELELKLFVDPSNDAAYLERK